MPNDAADSARISPQAKRRATTDQRLRDALGRVRDRSSEPSAGAERSKLTVAALAREAGVGRNAIYANHRSIIVELERAQEQRPRSAPAADPQSDTTDWRAAAAELRVQNQLLATENAALLKRAMDAEYAAEQAERKSARLTTELRRMQQPTPIHPRPSPSDVAES